MDRDLYGVLIALTITLPPTVLTFFVLMQMMHLIRDVQVFKAESTKDRRQIIDILQEMGYIRRLGVTDPALLKTEGPLTPNKKQSP